ncbi:MAG: prephenate dehydrogenase, partial [Nitrospirae bacterium]
AARTGLFRGAPCILCPPAGAPAEAVARTRALWEGVGARVEVMAPERHDRLLAAISHLPHVVAYALAAAALEEEGEACRRLAGTGFRDATRIARSSPELWRDICLLNREALLASLDRFEARLAAMRAALEAADAEALAAHFAAARKLLEGD